MEAPAWLVAYRAKHPAPATPAATAAPAEPPLQPLATPSKGGSSDGERNPAAAPAQPAARKDLGWAGFSEPVFKAWPFDGGKRREPALDLDYDPPRVVRQVGWRVCMCCAKPFWSDDTIRQRLCGECKAPPRGQRRNP